LAGGNENEYKALERQRNFFQIVEHDWLDVVHDEQEGTLFPCPEPLGYIRSLYRVSQLSRAACRTYWGCTCESTTSDHW
jgi:hypothetical protein